MVVSAVLAGLGLGLSLIVAIGAQNAFVLRQGLRREHVLAVVAICALADAALMPFVRQFAEVDRAWFDAQAIPQVRRWLAEHVASPLFERAMVRLKAWAPDDTPVVLT